MDRRHDELDRLSQGDTREGDARGNALTTWVMPILSRLGLIVAAGTVIGLGMGEYVYAREGDKGAPWRGERNTNWDEARRGQNVIGPNNSRVTIVAFVDFQCGASVHVLKQINALMERYKGHIQLVLHHYPLPGHPQARSAALAATCAAVQNKFPSYYRVLLDGITDSSQVFWTALAHKASVPNIAAFETCMRERRFDRAIDADIALGNKIGVTGTPEILVNGIQYRKKVEPEVAALVRAALGVRWWEIWKWQSLS